MKCLSVRFPWSNWFFLELSGWFGKKLSGNDGVQIFSNSTPLRGGGGPFPRTDSTPISTDNEPIFSILWELLTWHFIPHYTILPMTHVLLPLSKHKAFEQKDISFFINNRLLSFQPLPCSSGPLRYVSRQFPLVLPLYLDTFIFHSMISLANVTFDTSKPLDLSAPYNIQQVVSIANPFFICWPHFCICHIRCISEL